MTTSISGTLTPGAPHTATIQAYSDGIQIMNLTGTGTIWISFGTFDPSPFTDDCYPILGAQVFPSRNGIQSVRLMSTQALDWCVQARPA